MDTAEIQVMQDQHLAASTSIVEVQPYEAFSTGTSSWTSIDSIPRPEQENVRTFPGKKVRKFERKEIQLLEKIAEGGQGYVNNAKFSFQMAIDVDARFVQGLEKNLTHQHVAGWDGKVVVAKTFKGKLHENYFGQWPEELFGIHGLCQYICKFYGYSNDGESFMLLMEKYDCNLCESIDKHMKKGTYKGRPFHGPVALSIIIQLAIGMAYLHQLNIIHRDLKAQNILVMNIGEDDDTPAGVFIADFDVAPTIQGTGFWRAPEILQALKNRGQRSLKAPFTTKSDVYSFGMVCYEILTGNIPFEGTELMNYDVVLSGKRPELPSNLNHKMKDLLSRCWRHDPDARPTFHEIVSELQGFVAGTEVLMQLFTLGSTLDDIDESDLESNLVRLKKLAHVLAEKYSQGSCLLTVTTGDFVAMGFECVDALEEFKVQFGFESFKEHPSLPLLQDFARGILYGEIVHKGNMFGAVCPEVIP